MATSSPSAYRAGDVIVVPFPYSDRLAQKRRPALVVSGAELHALGLIWAVMITSAKNAPQPYDLAILDLAGAGLSAASVVRPTKIACLEPARVLRVAGRLAARDVSTIEGCVRSFVRA
jgi:mRNA interferase MazF